MNGIDNDKYWTKHPPWKQLVYVCYKKYHKALQKLKGTLHVASCSNWQSDYEIPGELHL